VFVIAQATEATVAQDAHVGGGEPQRFSDLGVALAAQELVCDDGALAFIAQALDGCQQNPAALSPIHLGGRRDGVGADLGEQTLVDGDLLAAGALLLFEGVAQLVERKGDKRARVAAAVDLFVDQDQGALRAVLGQLGPALGCSAVEVTMQLTVGAFAACSILLLAAGLIQGDGVLVLGKPARLLLCRGREVGMGAQHTLGQLLLGEQGPAVFLDQGLHDTPARPVQGDRGGVAVDVVHGLLLLTTSIGLWILYHSAGLKERVLLGILVIQSCNVLPACGSLSTAIGRAYERARRVCTGMGPVCGTV
jgi:hypothetical protein